MADLNPLTIGDIPEGMLENDDGSVTIEDFEDAPSGDGDFYENLADVLPLKELKSIGSEYIELVEKDRESRKLRDTQQEEGIRRTGLGSDHPGGAQFNGASRVVHPALTQGCIDFSARAIKELFPPQGPVKTYLIGDPPTDVIERAERKRQYMNWQLCTQMPGYRDELEQLLTQLPLGGSQYLKIYWDEAMRRPTAEFIPIDEVYLPFSANSFYTAQRVTHRSLITKYEFRKRVRNGLYRDIELLDEALPERSDSSVATDKIEGRSEDAYNEDGLRAVCEIYTWLELDDSLTDGDPAPYILTIDEHTEEVLAIYRNWDESDPTFEKLDWMVEFKFIPWRGAVGIGLHHLIGSLAASATGALRALLDSAHINNAPTMMKLKSGRVVGQNQEVAITQICDIEGPANIDDIRKLAMPMPFNQPSPVLFQLLQYLGDAAKGVIATADDRLDQVAGRTPVGTTQALIEAGSVTYSAVHSRLHESQKRALAILSRINKQWLSDREEIEALGSLVISRDDFINSNDIIPVSDPAIFSESQRYAQTQSLLQMQGQDAQDPNIPWNKIEVRRRMLRQLRVEGIDELLPAPKKPVTADPLTEADAVFQGLQIKADPQQDHIADIQGHLAYLQSPLQLQNPLVQVQPLMMILGHINEHIHMYQTKVIQSMVQQVMMQAQYMGQMMSQDQAMSVAIQQAQPLLVQQLGPFMQQISQLNDQLQKRQPPPQMPPEVQASIQIAQMDIDRKKAFDQATLQSKQAEQQAAQQMEGAQFSMKQAQMQFEQQQAAQRQQFEQYMEQVQVQAEARHAQLVEQVKIQSNELDNRTKAAVDIQKNESDNRTNIIIEQMKEAVKQAVQEQSQGVQSQPDLSHQLQQMQSYMDQMAKAQNDNALVSIADGLRATMEHLGKPKMIIRDNHGKAQGIQ